MTGQGGNREISDSDSLLRLLNEHGVDYVVVGGLAALAHGSSLPTFDLDVAYARDPGNLERLARVLQHLDVKLTNAPADLPFQVDAATLANGSNFTFDTPHGRFDILGHTAGVSSYDDLRQRSERGNVDGIEAQIASIDHMIAMKRAANRPKDQLMLEELIVIADEQRRLEEEGG
ncbi:MAG: hypothetical protein M3383_05640 [Actinomycetota bacterium]|nr:hypothetical protein [Actinomycetota bacterium]